MVFGLVFFCFLLFLLFLLSLFFGFFVFLFFCFSATCIILYAYFLCTFCVLLFANFNCESKRTGRETRDDFLRYIINVP